MYFAIVGKNPLLSKLELEKIAKIDSITSKAIFFDTENYEKCKFLAWSIKVGKLIPLDEFISMDKKLIWTNISLKPQDKQKYNIKRYKQVAIQKTDLEIKNKWIEVIFFPEFKNYVGVVDFYQNIPLYETIDYEKPIRSMDIGMMPSKLTHLMVNLATWLDYEKTIYDPFSGLGTTAMISNYLWNNVLASDINITPTKQNWKFWTWTEFYKPDFKAYFWKQDITESFKNKIVNLTNFVVSEGFLWPKVWKFLNEKEALNLEKSFNQIYIKWIRNLLSLEKLEKIVITFPVYKLRNGDFYYFNSTYEEISKFAKLKPIEEVYYRKWQKVWRQIVEIKK